MQPILLICGSRVVSLAATIGYTSGRHRPPSPAAFVAGPVSPVATRRGRSAHSRPALAMHKGTAAPPAYSAVVGIANNAECF
jgi:hypothetical protein